MSDVIIPYRFLVRGGTAAAIAALNEIPRPRELVFETDTLKFKLGDGVTHYNSLDYAGTVEAADVHYDNAAGGLVATNVQSAIDELTDEKLDDAPIDGTNYGRKDGAWAAITGGVSDGDKGDVVVSGSGTVWTLDTVQPAVHTWSLAQTFTVAPIFTDQGGTRTALGLGTLATQSGTFSGTSSGTNTGDQDLSGYAPLASPTLTGDPKAPTPSPGDNDTSIATTAFVAAAISSLTGSGATDIRDVWLFG